MTVSPVALADHATQRALLRYVGGGCGLAVAGVGGLAVAAHLAEQDDELLSSAGPWPVSLALVPAVMGLLTVVNAGRM